MTRIYIVRHAEAEGNLYRRIHGWYNSLITDNGYRQIAALARRFETVPIDAVYSSDLFRTMTTASAVYQPKGLELHTLPELREVHMGVWEDHPWGEIAHTDGERLRLFNTSDSRWQVEGGETFAQAGKRMKDAVMELAAAHPGQTVALFSHGTAIRSLQCALKGLDQEGCRAQGHSDNTGVSCIDVEDGKVSIVFENDNSHLPEELSTLARQKWWKSGKSSLADANMWYRSLDMAGERSMYAQARQEAWLALHGAAVPFDGEGFLRQAEARWRRDPRAVRCAMLGDEPAGLLELDLEQGEEEAAGYIPFLYLFPAHRGRGLAVQLIGEAVSIFRPMGRKYLRLRCARSNTAAQRFYARYGFTVAGAEPGAEGPLDLLEKYIGY